MAPIKWKNVTINTKQGEVTGIAPIIISASRRTDIPAFYSEWFMNRLKAGYVRWMNPANNTHQYVSFQNTRAIVFWTKNPAPMLSCLPELDARGLNYYFTHTLNDYQVEGLEPHVPALHQRLDTFKRLSDKIGKSRVVWRYDPLVLSDNISIESLLDKIYGIGKQIHDYAEKLVVSFIDISDYAKVLRNLIKAGHGDCREFTVDDIVTMAKGLQEINKEWNLTIATCSEQTDLSAFGIVHNKCIDDGLMIREFSHDKALMDFLGYSVNLFDAEGNKRKVKILKDAGQRKVCGCIPAKDIGIYATCPHLCVYCYGNKTPESAIENYQKHKSSPFGEMILG